MLLPVPWTGRTIIEETCDGVEGHLTYLTQSEELLIKISCEKSWRGAESKLIQHRILATKTGPHGKKHRKKKVLIFERLLSDTWSLRNWEQHSSFVAVCGHPCVSHSSLVCGDSSPTRLLIFVLWCNIWLILSVVVANRACLIHVCGGLNCW